MRIHCKGKLLAAPRSLLPLQRQRPLKIPHLLLWHTEDKRISERKALYTAEGHTYYRGELYVPDDREIIAL